MQIGIFYSNFLFPVGFVTSPPPVLVFNSAKICPLFFGSLTFALPLYDTKPTNATTATTTKMANFFMMSLIGVIFVILFALLCTKSTSALELQKLLQPLGCK